MLSKVFAPPSSVPEATTVNEAGGRAYRLPDPREALCQLAFAETFNDSFYKGAADALKSFLELVRACPSEFVAKLAVYAFEQGHMKDTPAVLLAHISKGEPRLAAAAFPRVIRGGRMIRGLVQVVRSKALGFKAIPHVLRRGLRRWFAGPVDRIFRNSLGDRPSMGDVIKMLHPKPASAEHKALFAYMIGRPHSAAELPAVVRSYTAFLQGDTAEVPDVPYLMLAGLADKLKPEAWMGIARHMSWDQMRQGLATLKRRGLFDKSEWVEEIAARLTNQADVEAARCSPYALYAAFRALVSSNDGIPAPILMALQKALDLKLEAAACALPANAYIFVDVSGSMDDAVTGHRKGATSKVTRKDAAAVVAAALLRKNPTARVLPFTTQLMDPKLNPLDSIATNAGKIAALPSGGTAVSLGLQYVNKNRLPVGFAFFLTDEESWADARQGLAGTPMMAEWLTLKRRCPHARMVINNLAAYGTTQAVSESVLHLPGWSENILAIVASWLAGDAPIPKSAKGLSPADLVKAVEAVDLWLDSAPDKTPPVPPDESVEEGGDPVEP